MPGLDLIHLLFRDHRTIGRGGRSELADIGGTSMGFEVLLRGKDLTAAKAAVLRFLVDPTDMLP